MRKVYGVLLALVLVLSLLFVVPLQARNMREADGGRYMYSVCIPETNVVDIVDIGDGYIIYMLELQVAEQNDGPGAVAAFVGTCCRIPLHVTSQVFHTIRTSPPPRSCVGVTVIITSTCIVCWRTDSVTNHLEGCATRCFLLQ